MQSAPEKSWQWMFGAPKLPSQLSLPPTQRIRDTSLSQKSDFYHVGLSRAQGQVVNEGKVAAVG